MFHTLSTAQLQSLFSQERLNAYVSTQEHFDNLALISRIAQTLGMLEIILRNHINATLVLDNAKWLDELPQELELKTSPKHTKPHQIISHQSLGFWLKVIDFYKIHNKLFDKEFLDTLDFKRYFNGNKNSFKTKPLRNYQKVSIFLNLFRNLRNRAFHFENLYKLNEQGKPRLSVSVKSGKEKIIISIETSKIELFLRDFISYFVEKVKGGEKDPLENADIITQDSKNHKESLKK
ncbi:hypothetical protein [Helicobacter bilis]|uniref:hypothetical protein n=1 Tax=Helicobacter bilis TaxID=37372 RepID=UPI0025580EA0|nr:hypothetical protein [Helicobacter bilis]